MHMNPPPPPPLHAQVRALEERFCNLRETIVELRAENDDLRGQIEALERTVARQSVQLSGHPFPGEG